MQPIWELTSAPVSSSIQGLPMLAATAALSVRNWLANCWLTVGEKPQLEGSAQYTPRSHVSRTSNTTALSHVQDNLQQPSGITKMQHKHKSSEQSPVSYIKVVFLSVTPWGSVGWTILSLNWE